MAASDVTVYFGEWRSEFVMGGGRSATVTVEDGDLLLALPVGAKMPIRVDPDTGLLWVCPWEECDMHPVVGWYVSLGAVHDRP